MPVAWGPDIFFKVPRLADKFGTILRPGRKRLYGKEKDPISHTRPPD